MSKVRTGRDRQQPTRLPLNRAHRVSVILATKDVNGFDIVVERQLVADLCPMWSTQIDRACVKTQEYSVFGCRFTLPRSGPSRSSAI
jgi:hypothetical protein